MSKRIAAAISGVFLLALTNGASAQVNAALAQAKARLACGAGTVVSSQFLPNGSLQVTCSQPQPQTESTILEGTGLTTPATLGILSVVTVLVIMTGGTDNGTTTTTTSSGR